MAEIGIGTIAAGDAKANADIIQISGHDGGTPVSTNPSATNNAKTTTPTKTSGPVVSETGAPKGATAQCNNGTYSFSKTRSGTCSRNGGVKEWLVSN